MKQSQPGIAFEKLNSARRKAVRLSQQEMINTYYLRPEKTPPLVMEPALAGVDLLSWAGGQREFLNSCLLKDGAILFRNFELKSASEFEELIRSLSGELLEYHDRSTPRRPVSNNIYTSTEYPSDQSIELHNECSYAHAWPMRIFFHCVSPAERGGETPIADCRKVLERISPQTRKHFMEKKVMYVRNFDAGYGASWQSVLGTEDRAAVEEYFRINRVEYEWQGASRLKTRQVRPATARHPQTSETVWFNQVTAFHVSTLDAATRKMFLEELSEENIPKNAYFGDGSVIEARLLEELREAYGRETVAFAWQAGDVLMLDNMLVAHGREPFTGPRRIVVTMADSTSA